jgi:hypothetical protein
MEKNINLAKILKYEVVVSLIWRCIYFKHMQRRYYNSSVNHHAESSSFYNDGKYFNHAEAEPLLFPSKEMRYWSKFAWKKGDILVNKDGNVHIIFEGFENDTYKTFHGKNYLWEEGGSIVNFEENEDYMLTSEFYKANKEEAQTYINTIEERLGGKLNRESLKVEKTQPEFKEGDIVISDSGTIVLVRGISLTRKIYYHAYMRNEYIYINQVEGEFFSRISRIKRFATDSEKQQLFDALAKEGKRWDSEHKMIVDLKPKVEFKPFDKVLCRNSKDDTWEADFFARLTRKEIDYTQSGKYLCVGDLWMYCIPYNEETAHLLGTTDDWEGGEQ